MPAVWNPFRRRRRLPMYDKPSRERHLVSTAASVMTIISLVVALGLPEWATSGPCNCSFGLTTVKCYDPESTGSKEVLISNDGCKRRPMTSYYSTPQEILISCILSISVLTILSSSVATIISLGYPREKLEFLRHYSIFNIVSLLCIILVAGFWLAVVETLPRDARKVKFNKEYKDTVSYASGYYVYLASGVFSLVAACFNLLRARTAAERRRAHRRNYRQRWFNSLNNSPYTRILEPSENQSESETPTESPPEYTEMATTEFMGEDEEGGTNDSDPLVSPPPPYSP